jgi:hypothetical protein
MGAEEAEILKTENREIYNLEFPIRWFGDFKMPDDS